MYETAIWVRDCGSSVISGMSLTITRILDARKIRLIFTGVVNPFTSVKGTFPVSDVSAYLPGLTRNLFCCWITPSIALAAKISADGPFIDDESKIANRARKSSNSGAVTTVESLEIACRLTV